MLANVWLLEFSLLLGVRYMALILPVSGVFYTEALYASKIFFFLLDVGNMCAREVKQKIVLAKLI